MAHEDFTPLPIEQVYKTVIGEKVVDQDCAGVDFQILRDQYCESTRVIIEGKNIARTAIRHYGGYERDGEHLVFDHTESDVLLEPVSKGSLGVLCKQAGTDEYMLIEGSALFSPTLDPFVDDEVGFALEYWPPFGSVDYRESDLNGVPLLLSRTLAIGSHVVWREMYTAEEFTEYFSSFPYKNLCKKIPIGVLPTEFLVAMPHSRITSSVITQVQVETSDGVVHQFM